MSLASMLTLNAVPRRLVFLSTMGAMLSSSSRLAFTGMHTRPEPWRARELLWAGVIFSAATTRSPSFSRSSSSTTMTNFPALMSSTASGTVASIFGVGRSLPAQVSGHVAGDDVGVEVDPRAGFVATGDGGVESVRNQGNREGDVVHACHRQADAVDRDRALLGDEPGELGRQLDGHLLAGPGCFY